MDRLTRDERALLGSYLARAAAVWAEYFDGQMSQSERERILSDMRAELSRIRRRE